MDPVLLASLANLAVLAMQAHSAYAKASGMSEQQAAEHLAEVIAEMKARPIADLKEV